MNNLQEAYLNGVLLAAEEAGIDKQAAYDFGLEKLATSPEVQALVAGTAGLVPGLGMLASPGIAAGMADKGKGGDAFLGTAAGGALGTLVGSIPVAVMAARAARGKDPTLLQALLAGGSSLGGGGIGAGLGNYLVNREPKRK